MIIRSNLLLMGLLLVGNLFGENLIITWSDISPATKREIRKYDAPKNAVIYLIDTELNDLTFWQNSKAIRPRVMEKEDRKYCIIFENKTDTLIIKQNNNIELKNHHTIHDCFDETIICNLIIGDKCSTTNKTIGQTSKFVIFQDAPVPFYSCTPNYPKLLKSKGVQGTVILEVEIFKNGSVGAIEIKKSVHPDLDKASINAVKKWKYKPALADGKPVSVWIAFPIEFSIK